LLGDDARRAEMGRRARGLAHPEAVREIGSMVVGLVGR
jgi:UDP-N-acetylglucosamine--N-acetylmuramyl-(pentapeptide) pyrophosphoryl-undecaprenol N-acetylglucosamine transferase